MRMCTKGKIEAKLFKEAKGTNGSGKKGRSEKDKYTIYTCIFYNGYTMKTFEIITKKCSVHNKVFGLKISI